MEGEENGGNNWQRGNEAGTSAKRGGDGLVSRGSIEGGR